MFSSGYLANLGAVTALSGAGALVVSDAHNHASIVDACRLSRADVAVDAAPRRRRARATLLARPRAGPARSSSPTRCSASTATPRRSTTSSSSRRRARRGAHRRRGALVRRRRRARRGLGRARAAQDRDRRRLTAHAVEVARRAGRRRARHARRHRPPRRHAPARSSSTPASHRPSVAAAHAALDALRDDPCLPDARARTRAGPRARRARRRPVPSEPDAAVVSIPLGAPEQAAARPQATCREHGVDVGCFRPPSVPDGMSPAAPDRARRPHRRRPDPDRRRAGRRRRGRYRHGREPARA